MYKTGRRAAARPKANTPLRRQWGLSIGVYVGVYIRRLLRLGEPCRAAEVERSKWPSCLGVQLKGPGWAVAFATVGVNARAARRAV